MQKKALVLAVGTALIATAGWAQKKPEPDSVVELYGKVYPELVFPSSSGATSATTTTCTICDPAVGENNIIKRTEVESSNSRFGVRGHEKLGGGLKATFQLETQFLVDSNNSAFAQRDSWVGLAHDKWGTVKLGRFDTPFKEYGDDVSFLGVSSGNFTSTSNLYRHIGFGGQNNAARFHERRVNALQYESPDWGPVEFKIQYSTNEAKTATRDPEVYSFGGQYEFGPFTVLVGYEEHRDLFGLSLNAPTAMRNNTDQNVRSKDRAMAVALKYKIGNHEFGIDANEKKYEETGTNVTGRVRSYKNNAYMFVWDARWSQQWRTAVQYIKATAGSCSRVNAECNTNGLEGEQFGIGVAYHFSRRTYLFLMGTYVKNGYSAVYNNSNLQEPNPGEDITQVGIGIHTAF
jgi:general bacterial porin, GBP family